MATRWGIIATGKISHDFTTAVRSLPQTEHNHNVVAVAARSQEAAQKFADLHNIPKAYGDYQQLATDPNVEVVYIGSVNTQHLPLAKMMLEHGKHLLVEKPLTLNLKHTTELTDLAAEKKLFIMEAIWSRFLPSYQFLKQQLRDKVIGDVRHVSVNFGIPIAEIERVAKKALGGGTVLDIGVYCINLILVALNGERPQEIKATGHLNADGVDESVSAALKFKDGVTAVLTTHSLAQLPCDATITGTKGSIRLTNPMWCTDTVYVNDVKHVFPYPETVVPCVYTNSSGLRYQAVEVRRCILAGQTESPELSIADSRLIASIEDELRKQVGAVFDVDD